MKPSLACLAIGMGWYPENPGNGLDRVFHALHENASSAGVYSRAIVVSNPSAAEPNVTIVDERLSLVQRLRQVRRAFVETKKDADIVASHFALYGAPLVGSLDGSPLVVHFHGPWADESRLEGAAPYVAWVKRRLEARVYGHASRFIVLSRAFREMLVQSYGADPQRVDVVPGGVDLQRFATGIDRFEARARLGWTRDRPIVLSVRRLVHRVGLENLIDAAAIVKRRNPNIVFYIGGRGPMEDVLRKRVADKELEDTVRFLGFVAEEDLPFAYAAADLSVVPTIGLEGFGLIAAESLASGTPALVTPVGGLPEVVEGLSGAMVLGDPSPGAIAQRINDWSDGGVVFPDAESCRSYAVAHYDWKSVARATRLVYERALAQGP